jgi:hypothetical protein
MAESFFAIVEMKDTVVIVASGLVRKIERLQESIS